MELDKNQQKEGTVGDSATKKLFKGVSIDWKPPTKLGEALKASIMNTGVAYTTVMATEDTDVAKQFHNHGNQVVHIWKELHNEKNDPTLEQLAAFFIVSYTVLCEECCAACLWVVMMIRIPLFPILQLSSE